MQKKTGITPRALQDKPELRRDCQGYFDTFLLLSMRRTYNEAGLQPLQVSEIIKYLSDGVGISGGERREKFLHLLLDMDETFMEIQFEKQKEATKK